VNVLALEGALAGFSVALAEADRVVCSRRLAGNLTLEAGLGALYEVLDVTGTDPKRLDRLAVGNGPGGFTGLRIAIAYAKSLALGWNLPLVAVSSFDLLEFGRALDEVLTVVVGRPGVISARCRRGESIRRASGPIREVLSSVVPDGTRFLPVLGAPEDVIRVLAEAGVVVEILAPLVTPPAAAAALAALTSRPATTLHEVRADYGEAPAAKIPDFSRNVRTS
jgi:tRNA threonylcarbamoyladenosine biosynthesis protein TsaB